MTNKLETTLQRFDHEQQEYYKRESEKAHRTVIKYLTKHDVYDDSWQCQSISPQKIAFVVPYEQVTLNIVFTVSGTCITRFEIYTDDPLNTIAHNINEHPAHDRFMHDLHNAIKTLTTT